MDASAYTGFHKTLAGKIIPYLAPENTICDLGCGLGRLDLELAAFVRELTAVDLSENVVETLRQDAESLNLVNVYAECRDATQISEVYDIVLMSFFGRPSFSDITKLYRHKLIRVVNVDNSSNFYPERYRCTVKETVPEVREELTKQGVNFTQELYSIEFGQPLRSWRDAELFVLNNAPEISAEESRAFLKDRIEHTGRDDYPFYLPNKKEIGVFIINKPCQQVNEKEYWICHSEETK